MLKIKMGLTNDSMHSFRQKKTNVLLDCSMEEFEKELINRFGKLNNARMSATVRSLAIKVFTIYTETLTFEIEAKEVNKITLESVLNMIDHKTGLYKEANNNG